ncbi:tripartite tricarboxylate transporter substrate binding protein [Siccirubricoccus sp. KC 17139]|uniref:Tripartite tricarboxylate transporter substrate binding protein n=1 Tax=Siccirubricoccus soli TaxID=2899147 RepID=A0ABT1D2R3_9PROT|nr:tripartite tricarboxylate transporter substrate binding protein [Siccirubricoccus soli]MCO6416227.1 tripartite tricarboxylate transporter substrate binding protein [Siccirubricoccus soli]MCP2682361.1 tripartite tricarboxylate transporter substrate binding protein [Siccirubricoccus soli]
MPRLLRLAFAALLLATPAAAQERTIRMVSGFAAGGSSDLVARLAADAAASLLQARIVVENRTGANGVIGAAEVARSAPDGNTVFQCPMSTLGIVPFLIGVSLPVDPGEALIPLGNLALSSYGFAVAANGPYRSVPEVLAAAREKPGQVTFGSAGVGSAQHLAGELLQQKAGVQMTHVPYRGATPAIVDILAGRTDFMITNLADMARQVQDGALKLLAIGDDGGSALFPDVPPLSRFVPGFEVAGWFGICGPRGMAPEQVARWEAALRQAMQGEALRRRLAESGLTPRFEDAATLARRIANDRSTWRGVIQTVGVRAE